MAEYLLTIAGEEWPRRNWTSISLASLSAQIGRAPRVAFGTPKAGLFGFTKALAMELAPFKINVNPISPGGVMTPMLRLNAPEVPEARLGSIPLHRFAEPEEICYVAASLASDEADFITGQLFGINGGGIVGI